MASAETAKLIASLELKDKFSGTLTKANRALAGFDAKLTNTQGRAFKAGQQIGTGIRSGAKIAAIGIGLIATQVFAGLRQLAQLESATAQTNAVLTSTKGVAGQTAGSVRALAEEYENLNATMDDKVIQSGANMLLTFTNIRKEAFEPALLAALNLNEAMGGGEAGLQKTIIQVGKALNDPAKGFTALKRVGVSFTEQQVKQIKALQKSGDLLGAQKIILRELGTEFGGSFAAKGKTAEGTIAGIGDAVEDLQKGLATALFPTIQKLLPRVRELLLSPAFAKGVEDLGTAIAGLFSEKNIAEGSRLISDAFDAAKQAAPVVASAAKIMGEVLGTAAGVFRSLPPELQALAITGLAINKLTGGLVTNIAGGLISSVLKQLVSGVVNVSGAVVNVVGGGPGGKPPGKVPFLPPLPLLIVPALVNGGGDTRLPQSQPPSADDDWQRSQRLFDLNRAIESFSRKDPDAPWGANGGTVGRHLADLKSQLATLTTGTARDNDKSYAAIERVRNAVKAQDFSAQFNVNVPVTNVINGRIIGAALSRFSSVIGTRGTGTAIGGAHR